MFHMSNDSHLFRTREDLEAEGWELHGNVFVRPEDESRRYLPLYEAKMVHQFNHRWATYAASDEVRETTPEERQNKNFSVLPRYWVAAEEVREKLKDAKWPHKWLMGWRDITNATNERTVISGVIPVCAVGNKFPLLLVSTKYSFWACALSSCLVSFVNDYVARQKLGGTTLNFFLAKQMAVLPPQILETPTPWQPTLPLADWLKPRILELTYTAEDMRPFAEDMGYDGEPFMWDEGRRFQLRAELDAAFFHLYLPANPDGTWKQAEKETEAEYSALCAAFPTPRHAVAYIMETFPIVKKKDVAAYGHYRTKEAILREYDGMLGR